MVNNTFAALIMFLVSSVALAANYPISAGASAITIQSTINSAAAASGGNTVSFAAGTYNLALPSSNPLFSIPCPASPLTITGPANNYGTGVSGSWNTYPTASLVNTTTGESAPFFALPDNCSTAISILYLELNGNHPTSGGGGVVGYGGNSNITIEYDYFHGVNVPYPTIGGCQYAGCSACPGCGNGSQYWITDDNNSTEIFLNSDHSSTTDTNLTIEYNRFGNPANPGTNDCGQGSQQGMMVWIGGNLYNKGDTTTISFSGYDSQGGTCSALWQQIAITNLYFEYNIISNMEEGVKGVEGVYTLTNTNYKYNDISYIHHSYMETQMEPTNSTYPSTFAFNDETNPYTPAFANWFLSSAQLSYSNVNDNLMISNFSGTNYMPPGNEFWGAGQASNNLAQGGNSCLYQWTTFSGTPATFQNSTIETTNSPCAWTSPNGTTYYGIESELGSDYPTVTNLVYSSTIASITSTAPTISPTPSGSYNSPITVTLTDAGNTTNPTPRGNTSIWYTTDGTTPGPQSGTSTWVASGSTISVNPGTTVRAVGMWGAVTQPASYPSGYGYTPSAIVSAYYPSGGTPQAVAPTATPAPETFTSPISVTLATTTPGATITYCSTNGATCTPTANYTGAIAVSGATTTIVSYATATGYTQSSTTSDLYTYQAPGAVPTPSFNPNTENCSGPISVTISDSLAGTTLYYTTDGSTPTTSSTVYSTPVAVACSSGTYTLKAIGTNVSGGYTTSAVGTAVYTFALILGNNQDTNAGSTYPNDYNSVYAVSGTYSYGYNVQNCVVDQGSGTVTNGANTDCVVNIATSGSAQSATPLCHGSYTNTGTTGVVATISMSACGVIPPNTAIWVSSGTNDPIGGSSRGEWPCGGSCNLYVPTSGNGQYYGFYYPNTYGNYSSMPTSLTQAVNQKTQYLTLTQASPPMTPTATPTISPNGGGFSYPPTAQSVSLADSTTGAVICYTTNGTTPVPNGSGGCTTGTLYTTSFTLMATATVQAVALASGYTASATASATFTNMAATVSSISFLISPAGTCPNCVLPGQTAQFYIIIHYSDGTTTQNNVVGTADSRGNAITALTSSNTSYGTISNSGLFTGVSAGTGGLGACTILSATVTGGTNALWFECVSNSITSGIQ